MPTWSFVSGPSTARLCSLPAECDDTPVVVAAVVGFAPVVDPFGLVDDAVVDAGVVAFVVVAVAEAFFLLLVAVVTGFVADA